MADMIRRHPSWWQGEHDSAWDRIKGAFHRDWEQTKYDFGGEEPDLEQDAGDTIGQMTGAQPIPEGTSDWDEYEPAYRFGYGARHQYGAAYQDWNDDLEARLYADWSDTYGGTEDDWGRYRPHVRRGWEHTVADATRRAA